MKMRPDDFTRLQDAIARQLLITPNVVEDYKEAGISDMQMRWDVLHCSRFDTRPLYAYLDDSHIDTALRSILQSHVSGI